MQKIIVLFCFLALPLLLLSQFHVPVFPSASGDALLDSLVLSYKPTVVLDYGSARDFMYSKVYKEGDSVRCVYTGHALFLPTNVDPSQFLYMNGVASGITLPLTANEPSSSFEFSVFPNPSPRQVTIKLSLLKPAEITIEAAPIWGGEPTIVFKGNLAAGEHQLRDEQRLPGAYFYRVASGEQMTSRLVFYGAE